MFCLLWCRLSLNGRLFWHLSTCHAISNWSSHDLNFHWEPNLKLSINNLVMNQIRDVDISRCTTIRQNERSKESCRNNITMIVRYCLLLQLALEQNFISFIILQFVNLTWVFFFFFRRFIFFFLDFRFRFSFGLFLSVNYVVNLFIVLFKKNAKIWKKISILHKSSGDNTLVFYSLCLHNDLCVPLKFLQCLLRYSLQLFCRPPFWALWTWGSLAREIKKNSLDVVFSPLTTKNG